MKVFKKILLDKSIRPKAFNNIVPDFPKLETSNNAISDLPRLKASNNAIPNFFGSDFSSFILKDLFGINSRLSNT